MHRCTDVTPIKKAACLLKQRRLSVTHRSNACKPKAALTLGRRRWGAALQDRSGALGDPLSLGVPAHHLRGQIHSLSDYFRGVGVGTLRPWRCSVLRRRRSTRNPETGRCRVEAICRQRLVRLANPLSRADLRSYFLPVLSLCRWLTAKSSCPL